MKLINVTVILLGVLLLTSCGKQADKTEGKKHTSTIQKKVSLKHHPKAHQRQRQKLLQPQHQLHQKL